MSISLDWSDVGGAATVFLLCVLIGLFIAYIIQLIPLAKQFISDADDAVDDLNRLPSIVAQTLWSPENVAVVASVFHIEPEEVEKVYFIENAAKTQIVTDGFPDVELTRRFKNGYKSRFMSLGYDLTLHVAAYVEPVSGKESILSNKGGGPPAATSSKTSQHNNASTASSVASKSGGAAAAAAGAPVAATKSATAQGKAK